jgi:hypothetical protein
MSTVLSVMGVPITGGVHEYFTGEICIKSCIQSEEERITFTFYAPIFAGTYIHTYSARNQHGYWGWH